DPASATAQSTLAVLLGVPGPVARQLALGPVEASSLPEPVNADICYRGEFVTMDDMYMLECSMKPLTSEETASLARCLEGTMDPPVTACLPMGPGFMNIQVAQEPETRIDPGVPPFRVEGTKAANYLPSARKSSLLRDVFEGSAAVLSHQTVNDVRLDLGENPASAVWLWGGGRISETTALLNDHAVPGAMLTQSVMARGLAGLCGMATMDIQSPWKWGARKSAFRVADVVAALRQFDLLTVYVEAPYGLGRFGPPVDKVRALEKLDKYLLGPLLSILDSHGPYRLLLVADWAQTAGHDEFSDQLPCLMAGYEVTQDEADGWDEQQCRRDGEGIQTIPEALAQLREGI
ncbi:MAG: hypothetical protein EOM20_07265, partial [Spartobacteria bacterium]|nr:hypothetical protein [Spartobacteria bacterium]